MSSEHSDPKEECNSTDLTALVDKYLEQLGLCREETTPTHDFLCRLLPLHTDRFPFSSVLPRLGVHELPLDFKSLYDTMVRDRRGGYCFQQNKLLYDVLSNLGYDTRLVLARVTNNRPDYRPGLTHRITLVNFPEETYVVDVAFGAKCPPAPVPLVLHDDDDHELLVMDGSPRRRFRVFRAPTSDPDPLHMQMYQPITDDWFTTYKFDLGMTYSEQDCEVSHFYSFRSPDAIFVKTLFVSRRQQKKNGAGIVLELVHLNLKTIAMEDGAILQERTIQSAIELRETLLELFGIVVSDQESQVLFDKSTGATLI